MGLPVAALVIVPEMPVAPWAQTSAARAVTPSRVASFFMKPPLSRLSFFVPNPFRGHTTVLLSLPSAASITLRVYDASGKLVNGVARGHFEAGNYSIGIDAAKMARGVCLVKLGTGSETDPSLNHDLAEGRLRSCPLPLATPRSHSGAASRAALLIRTGVNFLHTRMLAAGSSLAGTPRFCLRRDAAETYRKWYDSCTSAILDVYAPCPVCGRRNASAFHVLAGMHPTLSPLGREKEGEVV